MNTPLTSASVLESAPTGEQQEQAARRRFPRYRTNLPVRVRIRQQRNLDGCCFVIAEGGLGANLPEPISVGSVVQLLFVLPPHSTPLKVWAVVRHQLDRHHGFEFLSLTEDERLAVRQFCNELAAASH
jgi:hypothetical protein